MVEPRDSTKSTSTDRTTAIVKQKEALIGGVRWRLTRHEGAVELDRAVEFFPVLDLELCMS